MRLAGTDAASGARHQLRPRCTPCLAAPQSPDLWGAGARHVPWAGRAGARRRCAADGADGPDGRAPAAPRRRLPPAAKARKGTTDAWRLGCSARQSFSLMVLPARPRAWTAGGVGRSARRRTHEPRRAPRLFSRRGRCLCAQTHDFREAAACCSPPPHPHHSVHLPDRSLASPPPSPAAPAHPARAVCSAPAQPRGRAVAAAAAAMSLVSPAWIAHDKEGDGGTTKRSTIFSVHVHPDGSRVATAGLGECGGGERAAGDGPRRRCRRRTAGGTRGKACAQRGRDQPAGRASAKQVVGRGARPVQSVVLTAGWTACADRGHDQPAGRASVSLVAMPAASLDSPCPARRLARDCALRL
jgi:hypothetical protein